MTAPTPQQMRALADYTDADVAASGEVGYVALALRGKEVTAALRAAANQLEAVHDVERVTRALFEQDRHPSLTWEQMPAWVQQEYRDSARGVIAVLTADTAPQEGDLSKCDWPECPSYPKNVEKHEIESGPELHPQCKDALLLAERARREGWHTAPQEDRDE